MKKCVTLFNFGVITVGNSKFDVTFTPFDKCCNNDLNCYSDKIQEMLELGLLKIATPYLHKKLLSSWIQKTLTSWPQPEAIMSTQQIEQFIHNESCAD